MTRGLFYSHYGKIIPSETEVKTCWLKEPPKIGDMPFYEKSIGKGAFVYHYNKPDDHEFASKFYEFYAGHFAGAINPLMPFAGTKIFDA
jgi:hypothetical protein